MYIYYHSTFSEEFETALLLDLLNEIESKPQSAPIQRPIRKAMVQPSKHSISKQKTFPASINKQSNPTRPNCTYFGKNTQQNASANEELEESQVLEDIFFLKWS